MNGNLYVSGNNATITGKTILGGDISLNTRLFVGGDSSMNGNLYVSGNIYSNYYESISGTLNIGTSKNYDTVNIGYTNSNNGFTTYNIGNIGDTIIMHGNVKYTDVSNISITNNVIILNSGGSSAKNAGILINKNDISNAGYITTSADENGYNFKSTGSSNVVRMDTNGLISDYTNNAMVILKQSTNNIIDSSYTITTDNNVYTDMNGNLFVSKSIIISNDVSLIGNIYSSNNIYTQRVLQW